VLEQATQAGFSWLKSQISIAWKLPWHNCHKEILWRLAVNGVPWAGGHDIGQTAPCACGQWVPPVHVDDKTRALAWREHCFWSCPVAQAVRDVLHSALPQGLPLHRAHVWLLQTPDTFAVRQDVWDIVCMAALTAMNFGKKILHARHREVLEADSSVAQPGLHQATLHDMWHGPSHDDTQSSQHVTHLQRAQARAVAEFWNVLQSFAFLHDGHYEGQWWGAGQRPSLPHRHPFLAGIPNLQGSVRVMVPDLL
jgi:hypothetical protein